MIQTIIFGERKMNKPHSCFDVGLMGCKKITANMLGIKDGIEICNYTVDFENGKSIVISDTIEVSD